VEGQTGLPKVFSGVSTDKKKLNEAFEYPLVENGIVCQLKEG